MKLYKLSWEVMGGEDYTTLMAAHNLDNAKARKFIVKRMRKEDRFFEEIEILFLDWSEQTNAKALNGQVYDIRLIRKGVHGIIDRLNFTGK